MNVIKELEAAIYKKAILLSAVIAGGAYFIFGLEAAMGVLAGFFIGVFHFKLIVSSVKRITSSKNTKPSGILNIGGGLLRLALLAVIFWLAALKGLEFLLACAAGFFTVKLSIILEGIRGKLAYGRTGQVS